MDLLEGSTGKVYQTSSPETLTRLSSSPGNLEPTRRKRSRLSAAQKTEIWKRWKAGQSLHEIGRAFGKPHTTIHQFLLPSGGIRPAGRRRSRLALTLAEREDISRGLASGSSIREIARRMERAASTVSRRSEITEADLLIALTMPIAKYGSRRCDRSAAC